jgi:hypothetical protein
MRKSVMHRVEEGLDYRLSDRLMILDQYNEYSIWLELVLMMNFVLLDLSKIYH